MTCNQTQPSQPIMLARCSFGSSRSWDILAPGRESATSCAMTRLGAHEHSWPKDDESVVRRAIYRRAPECTAAEANADRNRRSTDECPKLPCPPRPRFQLGTHHELIKITTALYCFRLLARMLRQHLAAARWRRRCSSFTRHRQPWSPPPTARWQRWALFAANAHPCLRTGRASLPRP